MAITSLPLPTPAEDPATKADDGTGSLKNGKK